MLITTDTRASTSLLLHRYHPYIIVFMTFLATMAITAIIISIESQQYHYIKANRGCTVGTSYPLDLLIFKP